MPRVISFIVLLAIVLLVGALFFQVMAQFMVPMFLACVLLVAFEPLHSRILQQMPRWTRLAAFLTTVVILLVVLLPLVWLGWKAYVDFYGLLNPPPAAAARDNGRPLRPAVPETAAPSPPADQAAPGAPDDSAIAAHETEELTDELKKLAQKLVKRVSETTHLPINDATLNQGLSAASGFLAKSAVTILQSVVKILVGLVIMVIALYYFLADGPAMIRALMRLSPLDNRYERELLHRFAQVSRAVVVATLLSAVVQGALAGIGYYFALPPQAPIFLLTTLTMVTAMIPFFGAAAMWILVCGWVLIYGERVVDGQLIHDGNPVTALVLAAYCAVVVSGIDNIIKPLVLHGQSNLHPLLALLSILGGVTVLGPVGILVGPMVVSFLQALLNMLRKELELFGGPEANAEKELALATADAAHAVAGAAERVEKALATPEPAKNAPDASPSKATANTPANSDKPAGGSKFARLRRKKNKR